VRDTEALGRRLAGIARTAARLVEQMDFTFLYDPERKRWRHLRRIFDVTGVSQGKIPVMAGRISPIAASISRIPIKRTICCGFMAFTHVILADSLSGG